MKKTPIDHSKFPFILLFQYFLFVSKFDYDDMWIQDKLIVRLFLIESKYSVAQDDTEANNEFTAMNICCTQTNCFHSLMESYLFIWPVRKINFSGMFFCLRRKPRKKTFFITDSPFIRLFRLALRSPCVVSWSTGVGVLYNFMISHKYPNHLVLMLKVKNIIPGVVWLLVWNNKLLMIQWSLTKPFWSSITHNSMIRCEIFDWKCSTIENKTNQI